MRKIFTFILLAAALLVSVPSWAYDEYVKGTERSLGYYKLPEIGTYSTTTNSFGTICVPERIVATQGIVIYDVSCVDMYYRGGTSDTTEVARLVVEPHPQCEGNRQAYYDVEKGEYYDEPYCPESQQTATNPCEKKVYYNWEYRYGEPGDPWYKYYDYRMVAGASYFYTACGSTTLDTRLIYVDTADVATAPAGVNGFWGTFEQTEINSPVTVLTQEKGTNNQFLEQVTKATIPAHRGYFKGNFNCVPWRWNTFSTAEPQPFIETKETPNDIHYPCSEAPKVPRRVSSNAIAFNVGRNGNGLYTIDFEHPIYLNKETNKRIENGQLIIEAADGTKYNAFGQRVK